MITPLYRLVQKVNKIFLIYILWSINYISVYSGNKAFLIYILLSITCISIFSVNKIFLFYNDHVLGNKTV